MSYQSVRGMNDIGGKEIHLWRYLENHIRKLYENFGFHEVRTPLVEPAALFQRGVGDTSDIVEKEMYTFEDRNGDLLALRPEGTASIMRAVLEHNWLRENPTLKIYYFGPMYRHERPQKGRYRQHYQFGLEIMGVNEPTADAEIIALQSALFQQMEIQDVELRLSSVGCAQCRPPYRELLLERLRPLAPEFCADCQRRMERNPMRMFDCKSTSCQKLLENIPFQFEHLCKECDGHFQGLLKELNLFGISYTIDPKIVRGLDYYLRTSFEFVSTSQDITLCGGGRYDGLAEILGGKPTPGIGCGMGVERLVALMGERLDRVTPRPDLVLVYADDAGREQAQKICYDLRCKGYHVEIDLGQRSLKAQMKWASKIGAPKTGIVGKTEVDSGFLTIKDMATSEQTAVAFVDLEKNLR